MTVDKNENVKDEVAVLWGELQGQASKLTDHQVGTLLPSTATVVVSQEEFKENLANA